MDMQMCAMMKSGGAHGRLGPARLALRAHFYSILSSERRPRTTHENHPLPDPSSPVMTYLRRTIAEASFESITRRIACRWLLDWTHDRALACAWVWCVAWSALFLIVSRHSGQCLLFLAESFIVTVIRMAPYALQRPCPTLALHWWPCQSGGEGNRLSEGLIASGGYYDLAIVPRCV